MILLLPLGPNQLSIKNIIKSQLSEHIIYSVQIPTNWAYFRFIFVLAIILNQLGTLLLGPNQLGNNISGDQISWALFSKQFYFSICHHPCIKSICDAKRSTQIYIHFYMAAYEIKIQYRRQSLQSYHSYRKMLRMSLV